MMNSGSSSQKLPDGLAATEVDAEDNYFSQRHDSDETAPGRLYLGVCATGTRFKTILIRVYVAAMAAAQTLLEKYGAEHADPYMTLVGYFNSMRDLGGMRRVLDDAVSTRLKRMDQRGLSRRYVNTFDIDELTSRKSAVHIPAILDRLETRSTDPADKSQRRKGEKRAIDALAATNMISVGVDVSRLGLMVVANQPKRTAEYIQATSRIGRQYPGLVLTGYNWARTRDVSHYERFNHYHETFYQQVEALSVTPFASRALDRGLSAVLVSHIRLADEDFNENDKAGDILKAESNFAAASEAIRQRVSAVREGALSQVEQMMSDCIALWTREARNPAARLGYAMRNNSKTVPPLKHTTGRDWEAFTCLNSLRDVEPPVSLIHADHSMEERLMEMAAPEAGDNDAEYSSWRSPPQPAPLHIQHWRHNQPEGVSDFHKKWKEHEYEFQNFTLPANRRCGDRAGTP